MNTNSTYNWALTRVDSRFNTVSIFEGLDSKFTMLMIKSEIFHFCSLQVTFCLKKNIFWIPFMHSIHSLSQFYKEPIYVADSLVKISVEVRAT